MNNEVNLLTEGLIDGSNWNFSGRPTHGNNWLGFCFILILVIFSIAITFVFLQYWWPLSDIRDIVHLYPPNEAYVSMLNLMHLICIIHAAVTFILTVFFTKGDTKAANVIQGVNIRLALIHFLWLIFAVAISSIIIMLNAGDFRFWHEIAFFHLARMSIVCLGQLAILNVYLLLKHIM